MLKRKLFGFAGLSAALVLGGLILASCAESPEVPPSDSAAPPVATVTPGLVEDKGNPLMAKISAAHDELKPGDDEVVVYYYRADGKYADWGFWLWAIPGGDGGATWEKSKILGVSNGIGYLRFSKKGSELGARAVGSDGLFGLIPRRVDGWTKDGDDDRIVNSKVTNEWVIFSGDKKSYAYGPYVPTIDAARLVSPREILIDLSGRYGLETQAGSSGFSVEKADGSGSLPVIDAVNENAQDNRDDNYTRKARLTLASDAPLDAPLVVRNKAFLAPTAIESSALAARLADATLPPQGLELGAVYDGAKKSVTFRLWSPFASRVTVRLYAESEGTTPAATLELSKEASTGLWSLAWADRDPAGMFYEYSTFFGSQERIALDPWARGMDLFRGSGPGRGAIIDPAKSGPTGGWEGFEDVKLAKREDAIIYELSVRDFTIAPDSGVSARPGSYLAFIEKIPFLKKLGVTHVQLMPVLNFYYNDESKTAYEKTGTSSGNNYNWGYDPHNYLTPEGWYSSNPADPYARIVELKTLIKELHRAGIGVLLDVVYNHTGATSILEDVVPGYYYRRNAKGGFTSDSGCGNDTATERPMMARLVTDSLRTWVGDYKVDGFRFDLMGLMAADTVLKARTEVARIPGKDDVLFEGEGWKMYRGPSTVAVLNQDYMTQTDQAAVFNDEIRSALKAGGMNDREKGFVTGKPTNPVMIFNNLAGRPMLNYKADSPGDNLQYVTAHDNLTLHDNISFNVGLTDANADERSEIAARIKLAEFFVLTSQGIAFLHGGDERGRTKPKLNSKQDTTGEFVHNSYDSSDDINQFPWTIAGEYQGSADWIAGMIALRKAEPAFRIGDAKAIQTAMVQIPNPDKLSIGWTLDWQGSKLAVFVNVNGDVPIQFDAGRSLEGATVLVDREEASPQGVSKPQGFTVSGNSISVEPLTAVVLRLR